MHITAIFKTRSAAEEALIELETIGVRDHQISMVVTDETRGNTFNITNNTKADKGAAAGATLGGVVGGILGAIMAAGTIAIPGLNLVVIGALASGLAGLGAGAATGGLVGALIGAGIPEHEAKVFENEVKSGSILLAVKPDSSDQRRQVREIFERNDANNISIAA